MARRKRRAWIAILIGIVTALFLAEVALVAAVFVSPNAAEDLRGVGASLSRGWNGEGDTPGFRTRVASDVTSSYRDWIVPLWSDATPTQKPVPQIARKIIRNGEMEFEVAGQVCHPEVGEELLIPAGAVHSARNIGKTTAGSFSAGSPSRVKRI